MRKNSFWVFAPLLLGTLTQAQTTDLYRASHQYFASRTFDAESIVVLMVVMMLCTFYAVYLAVNYLFRKK